MDTEEQFKQNIKRCFPSYAQPDFIEISANGRNITIQLRPVIIGSSLLDISWLTRLSKVLRSEDISILSSPITTYVRCHDHKDAGVSTKISATLSEIGCMGDFSKSPQSEFLTPISDLKTEIENLENRIEKLENRMNHGDV